MKNKKRLVKYHHFRKNFDLRPEIESALEIIAENENVFDIEVEEPIVGHSKEPHIWIRGYVGNAIKASVHTVDKYGKKAGCKIKVWYDSTKKGGYAKFEKWLRNLMPYRSEPEPEPG